MVARGSRPAGQRRAAARAAPTMLGNWKALGLAARGVRGGGVGHLFRVSRIGSWDRGWVDLKKFELEMYTC